MSFMFPADCFSSPCLFLLTSNLKYKNFFKLFVHTFEIIPLCLITSRRMKYTCMACGKPVLSPAPTMLSNMFDIFIFGQGCKTLGLYGSWSKRKIHLMLNTCNTKISVYLWLPFVNVLQ